MILCTFRVGVEELSAKSFSSYYKIVSLWSKQCWKCTGFFYSIISLSPSQEKKNFMMICINNWIKSQVMLPAKAVSVLKRKSSFRKIKALVYQTFKGFCPFLPSHAVFYFRKFCGGFFRLLPQNSTRKIKRLPQEHRKH